MSAYPSKVFRFYVDEFTISRCRTQNLYQAFGEIFKCAERFPNIEADNLVEVLIVQGKEDQAFA